MRHYIDAIRQLTESAEQTPVELFLAAYYGATQEHPFNHRARIHGMATLELSPSLDDRAHGVHIHDVMALEPRAGHGTKAMQFLCALADQYGVFLEGVAKDYRGDRMTTKQLLNWYATFGFVKAHFASDDYDPDAYYDEEDGVDIIRKPKRPIKLRGFDKRPH